MATDTDTEDVTFTRNGAINGFRQCVPIAMGVFAYGLVFGVLAQQAGLSIAEALLMSGTVLAGAAQLIAVEIWSDPVPAVAIVVTTLVVNLRYLLMGAALRPWFDHLGPVNAYTSAFFLADENWALSMSEYKSGNTQGAFVIGSGLAIWVFWMVATAIGATVGNVITDPARWGLDFAFTAVFLTIAVSLWDGRSDVVPWVVAAIVAVVTAQYLPGKWYILVGGLLGSIAGAIHHEV